MHFYSKPSIKLSCSQRFTSLAVVFCACLHCKKVSFYAEVSGKGEISAVRISCLANQKIRISMGDSNDATFWRS